MALRRCRISLLCGATADARTAYLEFASELCLRLVDAEVVLVHSGVPVGSTAVAVRTAVLAGGHVVCVVPHMTLRGGAADVRGCEVHVVRSADRCRQLVRRLADGFVVLPGGLSTFDQLGELVTPQHPDEAAKPVVVANQDGFFDPLLAQLDRALAEHFVTPAERGTIDVADTVDGVLSLLRPVIGATLTSATT